jgi:signal transduction histidine kinase
VVVRTGEAGTTTPKTVLQEFEISDYWPKTSVLASRMQMQMAGLVRAYDELQRLDAERAEQADEVRFANEALEALTEEHHIVRQVGNAIDAGLLLVQDSNIMLCNSRALELLGVKVQPAFSELPLPLRVGTPDSTAEFKHLRPDGLQLWLRVQARTFQLEGAPGLLLTLVDQTEVREAEARRIQAETELLRTQHTEHIGLLAGGIAHDLNNLLSVVTSNGDFLREETTDRPLLEAIDDILGAARAAAALVRQLLAYSGSGSVFRRPLDLVVTVTENARLWRSQAREAGVSLSLESETSPIQVVSDDALVGQIMGNLLSNAIRHTPRGKRVLVNVCRAEVPPTETGHWSHSRGLQPGSYALLTVADEGPGIPAENVSRVFEPFFTTSSSGRGLGLAAVRGIVNRLGGAIRIRPPVQDGACFEVLLPIAEAEDASLTANADSLQGVAPRPTSSEPPREQRLLVLDDLPLVRKQLGRIAKRAGLDATLCASIAEAVAAVQAARFDVAIIDYRLNGETGDDALVQLRAVQPHLPAVLCTGYAGSRDFDALKVPFDAVVHKPFRPKELTALLFSLMQNP